MHQKEGESVAQYHVRLHLQVAKCGFTDPDDAIRSKILQTMRDKKLRGEAMVKRYTLQQLLQRRTKKISTAKPRIWSRSLHQIKNKLTEFTQREPRNQKIK